MENSYSLITPEGETVASVGVLPLKDRHLVHRLWVHPDYRGQGLAHRLLGDVTEDADREGALLESHPWGLQDVHDEETDRALYSGQGVVPQAPRTAVEALHARHGFSPLDSGEGFRPWVREPGRGLSAVAEAGRSTVYHLTDDPRFKLKDVSPEDNSLSINPRDGRRGLYVGDPMTWASPPYNYKRPYVVELSVPSGTQERGRWGGENFIPAESFGDARVERVMPFDHYVRREWNSPGETEEHMGKTYDTGEPLDRSKRSWQMSYPDTVDTKKEIDTRNPQQWSDQQHLDYLKARRDLLHDVHGWGWNEFDDQGGWRTPKDDEFDRNGEFIRRDREGKQMTRERRASTRTAAVNPIKPHLPWADLQGLTPHESSFQRSHPMVRRDILTNHLQAGNLKAYNRLLPIHRAQSQVDTIRARQGRPSPYMPHWQQQPYGNPAQHPMGTTMVMPAVTANAEEAPEPHEGYHDLDDLGYDIEYRPRPRWYLATKTDENGVKHSIMHDPATRGWKAYSEGPGGHREAWAETPQVADYKAMQNSPWLAHEHAQTLGEKAVSPVDFWGGTSAPMVADTDLSALFPTNEQIGRSEAEGPQHPRQQMWKLNAADLRGHPLSWDMIGELHPGVYGDPEVHGEAADGSDGEGIGWAASHLAFERPGHEEPDEGSYDLDFHLQDVPVSQIDYARHGAGDSRVRSAQRWYQESPDEVVPPVLVHRHGVYQVADGHHRSEAADLLGKETIPAYVAQSPHEDEPFSDGERAPYHGAEPAGSMRHEAARVRPTWDNRMQEPNKLVEWPRQKVRGMLPEHTIHYSEDGQGARCGTQNPEGSSNNVTHVTCAKCRSTRAFKMAPSPRVPNGKTWAEVEREDRLRRRAAVDESGLKAAGIAVIAMDTGRVLMQQRALNPLMCPCGLGVTWDDMNGYQHDDGSVSHDGEFYGQSVSDLLDQGHPEEDDGEGEPEASEDGLDKTAALEYDPNEGTWEFPGGKLDPGESPRDAARREFQEEVGQALPPGVFAGAWVSPGGLRALALHHVAVQPGDPMYGYGSGHTAPTHSEGYRDTLDNMEDMMPNYLEHPEWYGNGSGEAESEAWLKARRASGNPDKRVRIYRAVPHGISKIYGRDEMSTMLPEHDPNGLAEWVSTSKKYAQEHALAESCPKCGGHLQVISGIARAGDLVNEGYPTEFGYQGAETLEHSGSNRIYKTKCPAPKRTPKTSEQLEAEYDQVKHLGLEAVQKWEADNEADRMLRLRPKRRSQSAAEPGFRELGWKPGGYEGEWWRDDPQTGTRHSAERDGEEWYLTSTAPEGWEALPWQTHMNQPEVAQGVQDALQYRESTHMTPAEVHAQSKINDAAYGGMGEYVPKRLGRPGYGLDPAQTVHDYVADPEAHMRRLNSTDQGSLGSTDWWKWANAADPLLSGADPRGLQGDQQYGIDGVCPVPGRGGPQDTMPAGYGVADQAMPPQDPSIAPRTAADLPQRQPMSEAPDEHKLALIKAGWKPSQPWEPGMPEHLRLQPDFTRTSPATGIYHNVSWNGRENKWMYDATVPHWDNASFRMTRRSINPNDPRRNLGGRGNIPLSDPAEVEKAFRGSERAYLMGSEHGEPGIAKMFSDRSGSPYDEEYPDLSAVTQRSEPAFERRREGDPMKGTHPEPDVRYDDLRIPAPGEPWVEGYHNMDMLEEPPHMNPTWGIEKLNRVAKAPVYKGFIYLIEHEKDIDLTQREIHNPDDPDGDMTEQSAWWDIEDAKNNPALRKECREGTPWKELAMWADQSVRNNKEIKESFAKLAGKCSYCKEPATKEIKHSEGMGLTAVCDKHLAKGKEDAEHCTPDGTRDPSNINWVHDAAVRPPLPEGSGLRYQDAEEAPYSKIVDPDQTTHFWRWRDSEMMPPFDEANPEGYQVGDNESHHRSVDWQPMITLKPQSEYGEDRPFDNAQHSRDITYVKWGEPICEHCYLRYGSTVPAGSHTWAVQKYHDDLGEPKHEFKPMLPDVDARGNLRESKVAMPTTQHEPVVIGTEGSGEGAITRKVELPSGTWHAKSPVQYDDEGFPVGEFDEPDEEDADPDYWHNRQQDAVNREVFASKLGRAISNPDDEPLTPEVIQGTKASDPGPTAYSRTYPQYRDMQFGWLNHDDIEHHINSQRGQQHGFLHTVLGDGDKLDNNNMLLLGDPMEESSEKIQKMPTVSIDHTRTTLPAYAEARIEDPGWAKRLRFSHPNGEASDYAMRHFVEHVGRDTTPKAHNPLAPGDAERAIAASETMRPWAREQGVEHWLDAAQDRMRGLGEHASGTASMFPYQMAHERSMEHAASLQKQAITWDAVGQHADGCPTYQMRLMNQDDPVQAYVTDHTGHGGRMRWKITRNGVMQEEGKARRQYWTDQDVLNAYDRVVAQPPAQHEAATHWWLVPTS